MNTAYIPSPIDDQAKMENAITKTATFAGTSYDLGAGVAPGGPGQATGIVVQATALDRGDANETYVAKVQESADNATWVDISPSVAITAVGAISIPCFVSQRYTRVGLTLAGTTPSITYNAWHVAMQ